MKKGFTLIELLAVIVILAIIAVIATPIVIEIVNDSEKSTTLRSADFYIDAVEQAIAQKNIEVGGAFNPNVCEIAVEDGKTGIKCDGSNDLLEVKTEGEKPIGGKIKFEDGNLITATIEFENSKIVQNATGDYVELEEDIVCRGVTSEDKTTGNIPTGSFLPGDEYICEVKPGTEYHFFVVSTEDNIINLIMDRNINSGGGLATEDNKSFVKWSTTDSSSGPVTAFDYLEKATKTWTNLENININYNDKQKNNPGPYGYTGLVTKSNKIEIIKYDGVTVSKTYENLKARLPKMEEVVGEGKCDEKTWGKCPLWIANYLLLPSSYQTNTTYQYHNMEGHNTIAGIGGYWLLDSRTVNVGTGTQHKRASYVYCGGYVGGLNVDGLYSGVRPVISVDKNKIYNGDESF